jgi:von Willebrand factor type A domain
MQHLLARPLASALSAAVLLGACGAEPATPARYVPATSAGVPGASAAVSGSDTGAAGDSSQPAMIANPNDPLVIKQQLQADAVLKGSCASASVRSQLLPSNLLFVIDRSGSMLCNPPPTTDSASCEQDPTRVDAKLPSKWEIIKDALKAAMAKLPKSTRVGISYFSNDDRCGVNSTPSVAIEALAAQQLTALGSSLDGTQPAGGTPLVGATILAYKHLHELALAGQSPGNDFVVLLTDGEQSEQCGSPMLCASAEECTSLLLQEVPKAAGPGADIRTFVIGAPGSEPARAVLSQIAVQGKTAADGCTPALNDCHFDMTRQSDFSAALTGALATISGETSRCELPLPASDADSGVLDLTRVNVVYTPSDGKARVLPQDTRMPCDAGANGWQYSPNSASIRLCGAACSEVRSEAAARLDVVLGCPIAGPS